MARIVLLLVTCLTFAICAPQRGFGETEAVKKKPAAGAATAKKKKSARKGAAAHGKSSSRPQKKSPPPVTGEAGEKPARAALVTEIRHWSTPDSTRIAVTLDREAPFETHQIPKSTGSSVLSRLYFDVAGAKVAPGVKDISIGDGLLKSARVGQYRADTVRVVLDVDNIKEYKVFTFADPFRIIVDVKGERKEEISRLEPALQPQAAAAEVKKEPVREQAPKPAAFKPGRVRRIVVDPGHGGKDPGAIGAGGLQEKDVVLTIGQLLAHKLRDTLGIDVVMTRSTDVFIELQERTAIANQVGADLFVSIHANSSLNRAASGMETYYLNLAKTEKAAQLAARENGTSLEKVSLLQAVLFDLMANYKLNDSALLAEEVQKTLYRKIGGQYSAVRNLGVKQGPFYVLVGATMPSILVETAFISNEREESRLRDPRYLEATADGILEGIKAYIASLK